MPAISKLKIKMMPFLVVFSRFRINFYERFFFFFLDKFLLILLSLFYFLFFFKEFQLMTFAPDDSSLSSDQDTN